MKMFRSFAAVLLAVLVAPAAAMADFSLDAKYVGEDQPKNTVWERMPTADKSRVNCVARSEKTKPDAEACVVKYANPTERTIFLVEIKSGKLYQAGQPMDSTPKKMTDPTYYIFVQATDGKFYASPVDKVGQIHHSTFLAGGPVKTAGELRIEKGVLKGINNNSGHYKPSNASTLAALEDLKAAGIDVAKVKVEDKVKGSH